MKKIISILLFSILIIASSFGQTASGTQHTDAEAKNIINDISQKLSNGADFATLAKLYSEDPGSSARGGYLDTMTVGMMVPEFENVVFSLKENEISKPFKTQYGYHIATVISRGKDYVVGRHILI